MAQFKYISLENIQRYDSLIKQHISKEDAKALKSVSITGNILNFYKVETPTAQTAADFSIEIPKQDLSTYMKLMNKATAGNVVIAKTDGSVEDGGKKLADLATKEEVTNSIIPVATTTVAGKVKPGSDFDITSDGTISLYKAIAINSFGNNVNTVEKGRTIADVTLTWSINKTPTSLTLDNEAVDVTLKSKALTGLGVQADKTWTLKATDARNATSTKTTAVYFRNGRYWGIGTVDATGVNDKFVQGLTKELASNNSKTFTVNAGTGQYIYYAHPASFGTPTFYVGGFEGGFDLIKTFDFTNASGFKESYKVWRSHNASLGSTSVTVK